MADREEEVQDTSDYKLDKHGRKVKAHRIVFSKGEDDGKKGVSEQMKKTFNTFVEQHTPKLSEEQLKELEQELNEVLGKDAKAGDWIHDFVHSDNPKFAGKSKEKRKQMALAAYYSAQRNEQYDLNLEAYDHEKHNPFKHDTEEGPSDSDSEHMAKHKPAHSFKDPHDKDVTHHVHYHNGHTLISSEGHYQNSDTVKLKGKHSPKHIKAAIHHFHMNEETKLKGGQVKLDKNKNGKLDAHDFKLLRKEDLDEALHPEAGKVLKHIKPEHHAKYKADLAKGVYKGDYGDRTAVLKAAKAAGHLNEESVDESTVPEHMKGKQKPYVSSDGKGNHEVLGNTGQVKATFTQKEHGKDARANAIAHLKKHYDAYMKEDIAEANAFTLDKRPSIFRQGTSTMHDVKKTSTGTVYTKQRDSDGYSKEFKRDPEEGKRGRGRPKKNKFSEAVEFLMSLSEEQFEDFMSEGFDTFFETYDQLDEVSKATLGSYIKKATNGMSGVAINAHQAGGAEPGSKERKTFLKKANKRIDGIAKAADRLSK